MKKTTKIILVALAVVLVAAFVAWKIMGSGSASTTDATQTYKSDTYRFSLEYPQTLKESEFDAPEGNSHVILFAGVKEDEGFQIYVTPFEEDVTSITADRIQEDAPDLNIINRQEVLLGSQGQGVAFLDASDADAQRQIWFASRGYLYQVTAPKKYDPALKSIMNTWTFF